MFMLSLLEIPKRGMKAFGSFSYQDSFGKVMKIRKQIERQFVAHTGIYTPLMTY
jgi:hypothetical protein